MHEVAVPSPVARLLLVLPAGGLSEICDGRKVRHDRSSRIEAASESSKCRRSLLLFSKIHINVPDLRQHSERVLRNVLVFFFGFFFGFLGFMGFFFRDDELTEKQLLCSLCRL